MRKSCSSPPGLTLNDKCEFSRSSIRFLAHVIDSSGLHADPQKTTAVTQFPVLSDVGGIQRFMGMVNHLGKFIPHLADLSSPPSPIITQRQCLGLGWDLAKSLWADQASVSVTDSPGAIQSKPPNDISADASNTGLGAVLFQIQDDGQCRPVCYASRSLSDTEKRYAVIEKGALVTTWASERFSDYVLGIPFTLETDHKPLTVLLNSSEFSKMPAPPPLPPAVSFVSAWHLWDTTIKLNTYQENIKSPQIHSHVLLLACQRSRREILYNGASESFGDRKNINSRKLDSQKKKF